MEKLSLKNRYGLKIVSELLIPESPKGLAFIQHGLGGFKEQLASIVIANTLLSNNYVVVNFDATNSVGESGGKYEDATMQLHYEDLVDVIDWSKNQSWHREPFILVGSSLGGYSAIRYAEEYPNVVKGVFAKAPVVAGEFTFKTYDKFNPELLKSWKETGWNERKSESKPGLIKRLPWSHMEERFKHDLRPNVSNLTMSIVLIVGENDMACPPDVQKIFYDLLPKNTDKELHVIEGAPHTFKAEKDLNELKCVLDNWLKKLK